MPKKRLSIIFGEPLLNYFKDAQVLEPHFNTSNKPIRSRFNKCVKASQTNSNNLRNKK
jgi:hypothetical protein